MVKERDRSAERQPLPQTAAEATARYPGNPTYLLKERPGVKERSARVIRLKEELNKILELVVLARETLTNELGMDFQRKNEVINGSWLKKLKELTTAYNTLTDSRIRLDKSEKSLEREMTPEEEIDAISTFLLSLEFQDRSELLRRFIREHNKTNTYYAGKRIPLESVNTDAG